MGKLGKNSCLFPFKQIDLIFIKLIPIPYGKKRKIHKEKKTVKKIKFTGNPTT